MQLFPEEFRQRKCGPADFRIQIFVLTGREGFLRPFGPGRIGDIHEADPAARFTDLLLSFNKSVIVEREVIDDSV